MCMRLYFPQLGQRKVNENASLLNHHTATAKAHFCKPEKHSPFSLVSLALSEKVYQLLQSLVQCLLCCVWPS